MKKIYCDMDGVLCDFVKGAEKLTGKNIDVWAQRLSYVGEVGFEKNGDKLNQREIFGLHYLGIQVVNNSGTS